MLCIWQLIQWIGSGKIYGNPWFLPKYKKISCQCFHLIHWWLGQCKCWWYWGPGWWLPSFNCHEVSQNHPQVRVHSKLVVNWVCPRWDSLGKHGQEGHLCWSPHWSDVVSPVGKASNVPLVSQQQLMVDRHFPCENCHVFNGKGYLKQTEPETMRWQYYIHDITLGHM